MTQPGQASTGSPADSDAAPARPFEVGNRAGFHSDTVMAGLLVCAGYFLAAKIGFALTFRPNPVSVLWIPNSILLAALLLTPVRTWWFLLLAALPAHLAVELQSGVPLRMVLCWFISNCCEALIGAAAARRLIGAPMRFDSLRNAGGFFVCAAFLGPLLSSFLDAAFVTLNGWGQSSYWEVCRLRFSSNALAAMTVTPAIVSWSSRPLLSLRKVARGRYAEALLLSYGLLTVSFLALNRLGPDADPALLYTPLPFLLWAAVRFGSRGASTAVLTVTFVAIWNAAHGHGPFSAKSTDDVALAIQMFLIVVSLPLILLAAVVEERGKAEERFVKAFHSSPDAIILSRRKDGCIIEINERCQALFGCRCEDAIGRTIFDLDVFATGADRDILANAIVADTGQQGVELTLRNRTGELRQTVVSADTEEMAGEHCLILIIRDITDRKRAEEASRNLAHASRLAVVGELTAMIAHQINQPLGAILNNADAAELLLASPNPPLDEIRQILADVRKDDLRASDAVRGIRSLLRKRDMEMQPLALNQTVADVLHFVNGDALLRRVEIKTEFAPRLPLVQGDQVHLHQVLLNLILNGMEAMADNPIAERRILIRTDTDGNGSVEVSLTDRGPGIAADKLPRLFESFYTTKKGGMGLGLSIARSIILAHHGRIQAENNSCGGATFRITLPAYPLKSTA